jgi:hypothetical protein
MRFTVGDKVRLSAVGKKKFKDENDNPHEFEGVVVELINKTVYVRWSNDEDNIYNCDQLELVPEPKKTLNFWEARQAALAGKKVRMVENFQNKVLDWNLWKEVNGWYEDEFNADWEIVEEPVRKTYYVNVYQVSLVGIFNTKKDADDFSSPSRLNCLAITVDGDGKLVEARNI